jgi:hypothetical protein
MTKRDFRKVRPAIAIKTTLAGDKFGYTFVTSILDARMRWEIYTRCETIEELIDAINKSYKEQGLDAVASIPSKEEKELVYSDKDSDIKSKFLGIN